MNSAPTNTHNNNKIEAALDLSIFARKSDLKNTTSVDTSEFTKKADLASSKPDVDELDIDKLLIHFSFLMKNTTSKKMVYLWVPHWVQLWLICFYVILKNNLCLITLLIINLLHREGMLMIHFCYFRLNYTKPNF